MSSVCFFIPEVLVRVPLVTRPWSYSYRRVVARLFSLDGRLSHPISGKYRVGFSRVVNKRRFIEWVDAQPPAIPPLTWTSTLPLRPYYLKGLEARPNCLHSRLLSSNKNLTHCRMRVTGGKLFHTLAGESWLDLDPNTLNWNRRLACVKHIARSRN